MKRWSPAEVCLVILTLTIIVSIAGIFIMRIVTGYALSDNSTGVINNLLQGIGGGVIGIIAGLLQKKNNEQTP